MKIVCVGGGPAGLYFAICAKLRNPRHDISVIERSPEGVTFGWGIGFWDDVLDYLYRNDPVSGRQIEESVGVWDGVEVHIADQPIAYLGGYGLSMGRQRLLDVLIARARELGVELHFSREVTDLAEFADADLIVASDGINSRLRSAHAREFGTTEQTGRNYYLWLGTHKVFQSFRYAFEHTRAGWIWLHCYYLDQNRSTCIAECPPETWQALGFDQMGAEETLKSLESIFARHLDGQPLISQIQQGDTLSWLRGKQISNATWFRGNIALIGDAAHSTHFSIGSGTRLALGDSVALAEALHEYEHVPTALKAYDARRRPMIDEVQAQALRSMRWLEEAPKLLPAVGEGNGAGAGSTDSVQFAYAVSQRLGNRSKRWRYYLHLATQVPALRKLRGGVTRARRAVRVRRRGRLANRGAGRGD